ncbi:MAG: response regulator [bacterium]|nr:response regulator [bacterium]
MKLRLQGKFIGLLVVGLLLTLAVALWGGKLLLRSLEMQLGTGFSKKQVLYDKERSLRPILKELELTKKLAQSKAIVGWAANERDPKRTEQGLAALEAFRLESVDQSYFIALVGTKGLYFNDDKTPFSGKPRYLLDPNKQEDYWFFNTLKQEKPCRLNVDYNETLKINKVWINCVINQEGIPKGVVGTGFELTAFINQVINDTEQGISNLFIDSSGAIQAHRDHEMIDFNTISKETGPTNSLFSLLADESQKDQLRKEMFHLKQETNLAANLVLDIQGREYMVGLAYIPQIDWYNLSLLRVDRWGNQNLLLPIVGALGVVILLLFGLAYGMFKWLISDRLAKLDLGVLQMGKGDYSFASAEQNNDEIGRLAANVTEMARSIETRTHELEQMVNEKTAELHLVNSSKDKFFSIISHDLRGPAGSLAIILNEVITQPSDIDDELLDGMKRTTKNLYNLLNQLLEWARSQQGKLEMNPSSFAVGHPISEMVELISSQATQKGVELVQQVPAELYVKADLAMVSSVVGNLLSNAVKFTPKGGKVNITASKQRDQIKVAVTDTGTGMPKDVKDKLFKIDEKVKSSLGTDHEEGSGLGLILCAEFVEKNGGQIGVSSIEGKGSTFWFTLPKGERTPQVAPKPPMDLSKIRVLVVEDNPVHQQSSIQGLNKIGLPFEVAGNGVEALSKMQSSKFDLVLMDIDMPQMNGIEATEQIRATYGEQPVIFALSAYSQTEMIEAYPSADFPVYLNKPLNPDELVVAMYRSILLGQ